MVNEFCGFKHGVIGTDKIPADTTLNNMKKADLIKLLHTAQHNYETLMWFYNNAVKVNMSQLNNNGWISVEDALPEDNHCPVLACTRNDVMYTAVYDAVYDKWYDDNFEREIFITDWQPLPAPYKKGE